MTRAPFAAIALPLAAVVLTACFSERAGGPLGAGVCQVPVTVVDSQHVVIAIKDFLFLPDSIAVPAGTTVTWVNCEDPLVEPHTTTSDSAVWDSGEFFGPGRYSHAFPATGTFPYHCAVHDFMIGKVVVQ